MIMLKHNEGHQISFSLMFKINDLRVKSPTKPNTDLHNGNITITIFSMQLQRNVISLNKDGGQLVDL